MIGSQFTKKLNERQQLHKALTRKLRERTGLGYMACYEALRDTNLDIDKAQKLLNCD